MTLPLAWIVPVTVTPFPFLRSLQALPTNAVALVVVTAFPPTVNDTAGQDPESPDSVPLSVVGGGGAGGGGVGGGGVGGGAEPAAA